MSKITLEPIKRSTLTTFEVAEYIGVSVDKVYQMVREKAIPHFRIGSRVLFKKEAIDNYINEMIENSVKDEE